MREEKKKKSREDNADRERNVQERGKPPLHSDRTHQPTYTDRKIIVAIEQHTSRNQTQKRRSQKQASEKEKKNETQKEESNDCRMYIHEPDAEISVKGIEISVFQPSW